MIRIYACAFAQEDLFKELEELFGDEFKKDQYDFFEINSTKYNCWIDNCKIVIYDINKEEVYYRIDLKRINTLYHF